MASEIPVKTYISSDANRYSKPATYTGATPPSGIASAAAMAAVSRSPSTSEGPSGQTPITMNKYRHRQTLLTPPMSPTEPSDSFSRNPTESTWPVEKYFTSPRTPPSPPRQELQASEPESSFHTDSNNIELPKTLRHQQEQEPEVPQIETPTKQGFFRRSLTLKKQSPPLPSRIKSNASESAPTYHIASNNIEFPKTLRPQYQEVSPAEAPSPKPVESPPSRHGFFRSLTLKRQSPPSSPQELQSTPKYHEKSNNILFPKTLRQPLQTPEKPTATASMKDMPEDQPLEYLPSKPETLVTKAPSRHAGLANKTLRRSKIQHQSEPGSQSPAFNYVPLKNKTLRLPSEESRDLRSRNSTYSPPRETPRDRTIAETMPSPYVGDNEPRKSVKTDVRTSQLPVVTHEHVKPLMHHINTPEYTREVHHHDVFNHVLPVKDTEVLPTRHFAPSPTDPGKLVEIPAPTEKRGSAQAPAAPISMDMASNTTCCKDASAKFHNPIDNTLPFPSTRQRYQQATESQQHWPQQNVETETGRQLVEEKTSTLPDGTVQTVSVWQYPPTMKAPFREVTETITRPPRADWTMSPSMSNVNVNRPSVVSEWDQVQKPGQQYSAKGQVDTRSRTRGISNEIQDYRTQMGQPTETEPVSQRPTRPPPSRATPQSANQGSLLSTTTSRVEPDHYGMPQQSGAFEDQESSEYSSAASQQQSPSTTPKTAESESKKPKTSEELLPGGIWQRHSLVIPAGIVKDGRAIMGAGTLMESRKKEEQLAMHRLKKASKPEADRVNAMGGEPSKLQIKHEMEKLERRKTEERERRATINQDIQKLLEAQAAIDQEKAIADKLEEETDQIIKEDEVEGDLDSSKRRRSSLLMEAEAERQKARALQASQGGDPIEPGPKVLQAHRRRRSSLLHEADIEHEREVDLKQQKDDILTQMPEREAQAKADLDTAVEEATLADEERQEEVKLQKFLDDEVKKQRQREDMIQQEKIQVEEQLQNPAWNDKGDVTSAPKANKLPEAETQEQKWTTVVKPKSGKKATKGNGTHKFSPEQQKGSANHNSRAGMEDFSFQKKSSSPPKDSMRQARGNVGNESRLPNDAYGTSPHNKPRSWANIAASS